MTVLSFRVMTARSLLSGNASICDASCGSVCHDTLGECSCGIVCLLPHFWALTRACEAVRALLMHCFSYCERLSDRGTALCAWPAVGQQRTAAAQHRLELACVQMLRPDLIRRKP